jgi:glycosyltransferase involved in cell wall biosynthesis
LGQTYLELDSDAWELAGDSEQMHSVSKYKGVAEIKILVAIPCYNESLAIGSVVAKARRYVDEVLVIDDGSTDDTVEVAEATGATVVSHGMNKGYGAAIRSCFTYAKKHKFGIMVILDGDGQHDPSYIPDFVHALTTKGADIVIGSRFLEKQNGIPRYRIAGMKVLNLSTRVAGNIKTTDSQSGYRAYSRKAIEMMRITNPDMGAGSEILMQIKDYDLKVSEVPITARYDIDNTSTKNPVAHGVGVLYSLIGTITEKRPLWYIGLPGFITFVIGVFFGIQLLQLYNQTRSFSLPYAMLVAIFMILGAIGLFMGLTLNVIARLKENDGK